MTKEQIKKTIYEIFKNHNVCTSDFEISYDNIVSWTPTVSTTIRNKNYDVLVQMGCNALLFQRIYQYEEGINELDDISIQALNMYLKTFRQLLFFKDTHTCILEKLELLES